MREAQILENNKKTRTVKHSGSFPLREGND